MKRLDYKEFKNVSKYDFLKIKSIGRKLYKFFKDKFILEIKDEKRKLDINNYDDVSKIRGYYWRRVRKYERMLSDIKWFESLIDIEKEKYERDSEDLKKWEDHISKLLEKMSNDESNESDENNESDESDDSNESDEINSS